MKVTGSIPTIVATVTWTVRSESSHFDAISAATSRNASTF